MSQDRPLADLRFLMFVGDVYEDLELWYPKLRLAEAGAHVTVAGPKGETMYRGKHGYPCRSDAAIALMEAADFHGVVVPGGFMPDKLRRDDERAAAGARLRRKRKARGRDLPRRLDSDLGRRLSRRARDRFAGHQGRPGQRRRDLGRRARGDRPPFRQQPQARRPARLLPGDCGSDVTRGRLIEKVFQRDMIGTRGVSTD